MFFTLFSTIRVKMLPVTRSSTSEDGIAVVAEVVPDGDVIGAGLRLEMEEKG